MPLDGSPMREFPFSESAYTRRVRFTTLLKIGASTFGEVRVTGLLRLRRLKLFPLKSSPKRAHSFRFLRAAASLAHPPDVFPQPRRQAPASIVLAGRKLPI